MSNKINPDFTARLQPEIKENIHGTASNYLAQNDTQNASPKISTGYMAGPKTIEKKGEVLIVLSAVDYLELKETDLAGKAIRYSTGYFLNELAIPLIKLVIAGYRPVFATPGGKAPTMDKGSANAMFFNNSQENLDAALAFIKGQEGMKKPLSISDLAKDTNRLDKFVGVFIPGGHAPMQDLYQDRDLGNILRYFHEKMVPAAAICHGPAALLSTRKPGEDWPYKNYKMTAYSDEAEKTGETNGWLNGGHVKFYLSSELEKAGAIIENAGPLISNIKVHEELITGQNPQSDGPFAEVFIKSLDSYLMSTELAFPNGVVLRRSNQGSNEFNNGIKALKDWLGKSINSGEIKAFGDKIISGHTYSILGKSFDLKKGHTTFFIGTRKTKYPPKDFLPYLSGHVKKVAKAFSPMGLTGYIVLASDNYELAIMNWESEQKMNEAFNTQEGKTVVDDANKFLDGLMWKRF